METAGRTFTKIMKSMKNQAKLPITIIVSVGVGRYRPQAEGRKSCARDVTMMTNRSSYMPISMEMQMATRAGMLVLTLFHQLGIVAIQRPKTSLDSQFLLFQALTHIDAMVDAVTISDDERRPFVSIRF